MSNKTLTIGVLVAIVIAIVGLFTPVRQAVSQAFGGTTNYDTVSATGLQIGVGCNDSYKTCLGSSIAAIFKGTCTLLADSSVTATSTKNFDCAIPNVQPGDIVQAQLNASTTPASQYVIKGVMASTTPGFITISLLNLTGTSAVPSATNGFGSSTDYEIFR